MFGNYYDNSFSPNMCHVCKKLDNGNFITCDKCQMITYCGQDDKRKNDSSHKEICAVIQKILEKDPQRNTRRLRNREEWIQSRKLFLISVLSELSRDLQPFEAQMIMFAKSCLLCNQQEKLKTCLACYNANYCADHEDDFKRCHSSNCKELEVCCRLDRFGSFECKNKFFDYPDKTRPVTDMDTFINLYVRVRNYDVKIDDWHYPQYYYSDYASSSLTLYYGMRNANLFPSYLKGIKIYVVHVIDTKFFDKQYFRAWELFMHDISSIKHLKIVMIGTGLQSESGDIEICSICCHRRKQKFSFVSSPMLYYNYATSELYEKPNVIIGCHIDLRDERVWSKSTMLSLREQNCPVFLTAISKLKADQNINRIHEVFGTSVNPVYHDNNKFASRRPWRNFETDGVFYRNRYLTIYRNLHN